MTSVLPDILPAHPRPGQVAIDPASPCVAPGCGIAVAEHTGTAYHVDGFPVGSARCADLLYRARRAPRTCCETLPGEPHDCDRVAADARALLAGLVANRRPILLDLRAAR